VTLGQKRPRSKSNAVIKVHAYTHSFSLAHSLTHSLDLRNEQYLLCHRSNRSFRLRLTNEHSMTSGSKLFDCHCRWPITSECLEQFRSACCHISIDQCC